MFFAETHRGVAPAGIRGEEDNIKEKSVDLVVGADLPDMGFYIILIIRVKEVVEFPHAGLDVDLIGGSKPSGKGPRLGQLSPLRMLLGRILFPGNGRIDGAANSFAV